MWRVPDGMRLLIIPIAAALMLAAAPGPAAAGSIFTPQLVETGSGDVRLHVLAGNDRGDRIVVYSRGAGPLRVAFAAAGGAFGPSQELGESTGADDIQAAVGPTGDAMIAWHYFDGSLVAENADVDPQCCTGLKAAVLPRDGAVGATATPWPRGTEVFQPRIAIHDRRRFGVVATVERLAPGPRGDEEPLGVQARMATPRGGWGPVEQVGPAGDPRALSITGSAVRVAIETGGLVAERSRSPRGRWGRARRLIDAPGGATVVLDPRGGAIFVSGESTRDGKVLRVGVARAGKRPRIRVVDRISRGVTQAGGGGLAVAPNGAAIFTWSIGNQWYRAERRPGRGFNARRLAFAGGPESTPYAWAVNSRGRWVAAIQAGGRWSEDENRLRLRTGVFGGRVSGSRLAVNTDARDPFVTLPPVIDRTGTVHFVTAVRGALVAWAGR
jgi:hypothetical protein